MICPVELLKTTVAQPALVGQRTVGRWSMHLCLACGQTTHASLNGKLNGINIVLIPKAIQVLTFFQKLVFELKVLCVNIFTTLHL